MRYAYSGCDLELSLCMYDSKSPWSEAVCLQMMPAGTSDVRGSFALRSFCPFGYTAALTGGGNTSCCRSAAAGEADYVVSRRPGKGRRLAVGNARRIFNKLLAWRDGSPIPDYPDDHIRTDQ